MPAEWWRVGAAALPLIALLVGLLILRWPGVRAGLVALTATLVLAATAFAASPGILAVALWRAAAPRPHAPLIVLGAPPLFQDTDATPGDKNISGSAAPLPKKHNSLFLITCFSFNFILHTVPR